MTSPPVRKSDADAAATRGPILHLASGSARRRRLLEEHGVPFLAVAPGVDDGELRPGGVSAREWVAALAYLKARAGLEEILKGSGVGGVAIEGEEGQGEGAPAVEDDGRWRVVLGADTVVVKGGEIIGQARDREHAAWILRRLESGSHDVLTGVALLATRGDERLLLVDSAGVAVGEIGEERIGEYLDSGEWQGKAGAYNLAERLAAGWPILCAGDPTTVMGLPMRRLTPLLEARLPGWRARERPEAAPC